MNPWLEAVGALLVGASGVWLGWWFARRRSWYWALGYFIPLALIGVYDLAARKPALALVPPFSWVLMGRGKFAVIGFVAAIVLAMPSFRLPRRRDRHAVFALVAVIVAVMSVWPFLAPAFNRSYLESLHTKTDGDGVCLQNTAYTCGPAAAVTALHRLGLPAEEGQIAILAHASSAIGTPPEILARALERQYGKDGLVVKYRSFKSVAELKDAGLTLAVVKLNFFLDHYVTVFEVMDDQVIVGDPLTGRTKLSRQEFEQRWRFVGVVLTRSEPQAR
jgi:hypothetical protein